MLQVLQQDLKPLLIQEQEQKRQVQRLYHLLLLLNKLQPLEQDLKHQHKPEQEHKPLHQQKQNRFHQLLAIMLHQHRQVQEQKHLLIQ